MQKPKGHELTLVKRYKTLVEWFEDLSLDDKLNLYEHKINLDSGKYLKMFDSRKQIITKKGGE